jgi:hypothetical protein
MAFGLTDLSTVRLYIAAQNNTAVVSFSSSGGSSTTTPTTTTLSNGAIGVNVAPLGTLGTINVSGGYYVNSVLQGRPLYQQVTASPLTVASNSYFTYYNITYSSLTAITLPAVVGSTDANAYWVFRNNSGSSLSITFTYTTAGTTYPSNPVSIPSASSVTMMVTYPSSVLGYVLF